MKVGSRLVIDAGTGGGIGYGFCDSMENAEIDEKKIMDRRIYHSINEVKNGQGPAPIKTDKGWLHLAHGVRGTAGRLLHQHPGGWVALCGLPPTAHGVGEAELTGAPPGLDSRT
jgi:hypothetical protein